MAKKMTPKQYRELCNKSVTLFFSHAEDALRRVEYMLHSGGFVVDEAEGVGPYAFEMLGGANAGRYCVKAIRVDGFEA